MIAADPVKSRQTDYRFFAEEEEKAAAALEEKWEAESKQYTPQLKCKTNYPTAQENPSCFERRYRIYFDRNMEYLTTQGKEELGKLNKDLLNCDRFLVKGKAHADFGEDERSDGKDLADGRASYVTFLIMSSSRTGPGTISIARMAHSDLPVKTPERTSDARNQVVDLSLVCDSR